MGLSCWFEHMIPSLMPFMILTNYLLQTGLSNYIIWPIYQTLNPVFRMKSCMIFAMITGFLCGFPIGAKTVASLYQTGELTKQEADYLLAFTNNIGPAYYICFLYPLLLESFPLSLLLFIQYGIPMLYGLTLRYTVYRNISGVRAKPLKTSCTPLSAGVLNNAIKDATSQILALGGYMILFNVFAGIVYVLPLSKRFICLLHMGIEISGGIDALYILQQQAAYSSQTFLLYIQSFLAFGGLCCLFQTMNVLDGTDLSIQKYMLHKVLLCSITCIVILILNQVKII